MLKIGDHGGRKALARLLIFGVLSLSCVAIPQTANALGLANCVVVTKAGFDSYFQSYSFTVQGACSSTGGTGANYTQLDFYPDAYSGFPKRFIYTLSTYAQTFRYDIKYDGSMLKPGNHSPYLNIRVLGDQSTAKINLPSFTTEDPIECVEVVSSQLDSYSSTPSLRVVLKNACKTLNSSQFDDVYAKLNIPGFYGLFMEKWLSGLSEYSSTFNYDLTDIKKGTYWPTLVVRDKNFNERRITLQSFTIGRSTSNSGTTSGSKQLCVYAKGFDRQCSDYPDFTFDFCSSLKNGTLQELRNGKWTRLWTITGTKDLENCNTKWPYSITVSGTTTPKSQVSMRIVFSGTSSVKGFSQNFTVRVHRTN